MILHAGFGEEDRADEKIAAKNLPAHLGKRGTKDSEIAFEGIEQSIRDQYARRRELFADPRVLPDFELKTLRAVQSLAGSKTPFADWFEAYDHMCERISTIDFDVAVIGCGAYGFPLAAHVKRLGKHAVHLGGATQYLFGIRAKAADENPKMRALYTDAWVRPRDDERPENYLAVEQGRYW